MSAKSNKTGRPSRWMEPLWNTMEMVLSWTIHPVFWFLVGVSVSFGLFLKKAEGSTALAETFAFVAGKAIGSILDETEYYKTVLEVRDLSEDELRSVTRSLPNEFALRWTDGERHWSMFDIVFPAEERRHDRVFLGASDAQDPVSGYVLFWPAGDS